MNFELFIQEIDLELERLHTARRILVDLEKNRGAASLPTPAEVKLRAVKAAKQLPSAKPAKAPKARLSSLPAPVPVSPVVPAIPFPPPPAPAPVPPSPVFISAAQLKQEQERRARQVAEQPQPPISLSDQVSQLTSRWLSGNTAPPVN